MKRRTHVPRDADARGRRLTVASDFVFNLLRRLVMTNQTVDRTTPANGHSKKFGNRSHRL